VNRVRARLGATALGVGGVAFALIQILERTIGTFNPRPGISLLVAVTVGVAGLTLERTRHRVGERSFLSSVLSRWPACMPASVDPVTLGVFPSRASATTYIPRTADARVDEALQRGGLVLLTGPERSGKSRTAYEALRRLLPTSPLVVPAGGPALGRLLEDGSFRAPRDAVWWLDDLERFLPHVEARQLGSLLDEARTVVATVRTEPWQALLRAGGESGEQGRRLFAAARPIHVPAQPDPAEVAAAAEIHPGLDVSQGIGEACAAGGDGSAVAPALAGAGEDRRGRHVDPVLVLGVAATMGLMLALVAVGLTGGFLTRTPPAIGTQIDTIRKRAEAAGSPVVETLAAGLHGFDQHSYVFVLRSPTQGSDELRIYDDVHGWLRRRLDFRPKTRAVFAGYSAPAAKPQQKKGVGVDYTLERPVAIDVNGDGDAELVADYALPSYLGVRLPVGVAWDDAAQRYELFSFLTDAPPAIGRATFKWDYFRGLFTLNDPRTHQRLAARAVSSFLVIPAATGLPSLLATATEVDLGHARKPGVAVSAYRFSLQRGRPEGMTLSCAGGSGQPGVALVRTGRADAADYRGLLGRLAPEIEHASGEGEVVGGACVA
jgi:hypothetical protein